MTKSEKPTDATTQSVAAMSQAMLAANPALAGIWSELASESARFVSQRLQEDIKAQTAMLACKTPADLAKLQAEFFQTAMSQYTEEVYRIADIMLKATGPIVQLTKTGRSRDYDDVPI